MKLNMFVALLALGACASTSVTPVSRNQIIVSTSAAPVCHQAGAQSVVSRMAAVETLRHGFERFVIAGMDQRSDAQAVTLPPTGAYTTGSFTSVGNTTTGFANTTFTGGGTFLRGTHDASVLVVMFNKGDPGYTDALDAKAQLGTEWQDLVEKGVRTCT